MSGIVQELFHKTGISLTASITPLGPRKSVFSDRGGKALHMLNGELHNSQGPVYPQFPTGPGSHAIHGHPNMTRDGATMIAEWGALAQYMGFDPDDPAALRLFPELKNGGVLEKVIHDQFVAAGLTL